MAVSQNSIIGRTSGKVGGIVFSSAFGKNVIKSKPVSVANPNTLKQQDQRVALSIALTIYRAISGIVGTSFKQQAVGMSPYNAFIKYAKTLAFDYAGDGIPEFQPLFLLVSKGSITPTPATSKEIEIPAKSITVSFDTTVQDASQSSTDKVLIVAYNSTRDQWYGEVTTSIRSAGSASITFPYSLVAGDQVFVYHAFVKADGSKSSNSIVESVAVPMT